MKMNDPLRTLIPCLILGFLTLSIGPSLPAQEEREEILEDRNLFTKTFDNRDGTETLHTRLEPLHYQPPGEEAYLNIDPSLIEEAGWHNQANSFPSQFPEMLGDGAPIELGPELGIRWRPGALVARTTSGLDVELGLPAPSWGERTEEVANAVIYPDLYPGLDLLVEVRRGSLNLVTLFREWPFSLAPEQIEFLYIEASLELDASLLEAVEERAGAGEPFEEIPLYFGRRDDEYVIALAGHPGVSEAQLEDFADALFKNEEGERFPAPDDWRSNTANFLSTGTIRHYFRHPSSDSSETHSRVGTVAAALTASFKIENKITQIKSRFFTVTATSANLGVEDRSSIFALEMRCLPKSIWTGFRCKGTYNSLSAGKAEGYFYRTFVGFRNIGNLQEEMISDPSLEIVNMRLGFRSTTYRPQGVMGDSTAEIIAYSAVEFLSNPDAPGALRIKHMPDVFPNPYNQWSRTVPGGSMKTSTWDYRSQEFSMQTINGKTFYFGDLSNKDPGSSVPRAIKDFRTLVIERSLAASFLLAMPYDNIPCPLCTANHFDPAIQALNGDYQVGAGFFDLSLEITTRKTSSNGIATLTATSVGGHNDRLYPGETLAWDVELTGYTGPPDVIELNHVQWSTGNRVDFWFTDPASGTTLYNPPLSAVGDKVRIHAKWTVADPSLYGKTKDLEIFGWFQQTNTSGGGAIRIPIHLKAPEAQPTFSQIYPIFDDNVSDPTGLVSMHLPTQGLRATSAARASLDWVSGPTKKLIEGQHWDVWSSANLTYDGEVVIYPDQFQPGTYSVDLTPCLWPNGPVTEVHCLKGQEKRITFDVRAAAPANYPPSIDFISPWSIDSPSGGPVIVSVQGLNLGGTDPTTKVKIPQLLAQTTPQTGSTNTRVSVRIQTASNQVCGPRNLSVITAGGTDTAIFNVTKPFSSGTNHFAVEAEAGIASNLSVQSFSGASNGQVVGHSSTGTNGRLTLFFQVPATADYQVYALYTSLNRGISRAEIEIMEEDPATGTQTTIKKFTHALASVPANQVGLKPIFDSANPRPPSTFSLQAGKYYRLELTTVSGQEFPIYDLLVFTDGSLGPKLAEICQ